MILIDPDLDPDAAPRPRVSTSKRASPTRPTPIDRDARVPSARTLGGFLREAQTAVRLRGQVSVLLTTDRKIRQLNRHFRGKNKATDVLSFPAAEAMAGKVAGDLAVSIPTALRQAREQDHPLAVELKILILHGLLHLAGFDHEQDKGEMARRERLLRTRFRLPQGLIERTSEPPQNLRAPSSRFRSVAVVGNHRPSRAPRTAASSAGARRATTGRKRA